MALETCSSSFCFVILFPGNQSWLCLVFGPPPEADLGPMISPAFVGSSVRPSVRSFFLETKHSIFLIFCTDLYNNETKKVTFLFFPKKNS